METRPPDPIVIRLGALRDLAHSLPDRRAPRQRVEARLPPGVVRAPDRGSVGSAGAEGVELEEYQYGLESPRNDAAIGITPAGLDRSYGIFGYTGSGKTVMVMHVLRQLLGLRFDEKGRYDPNGAVTMGGLIIDPKGSMYADVEKAFRAAGRAGDLISIGDHQEEALNVIETRLDPQSLGAALRMAAQSAGVRSMEPSWMNELEKVFGAVLHVFRAAYDKNPTLDEMASALLDDVSEGAGRIPKFKVVMRQLEEKGAAGSDAERRDLEISKNVLIALSEYEPREYSILRSFIRQCYGEFQYSRQARFSGASSRRIYDEVLQQGKVVLVSVSPENLAIARVLCTVVKCIFQHAVLTRDVAGVGARGPRRPLFFIADEYSDVATELKESALGDGKFFSKMREFGCMGVVATQSVNMMLQAMSKEDWEAIYSNLSAKVFMKLGDPETAEAAKKLASESQYRVTSWSKSVERSRVSRQSSYDVRERVEFPVKLLTQGFVTGDAVVIGDLTGGKETASIRFFHSDPPPPKEEAGHVP